jgi:chorismate mutase
MLNRYMQQRIRARILQLLHAIAARFEAGEEIAACKGKHGKGMGKYLRTVLNVDPGKIRVWRFRADVADQQQLLAMAHEQKPVKLCSKCNRPKDRCRCPATERIQKAELDALRGVVAAAAPVTVLDEKLSAAVEKATCSMTAEEKTKWGIRLPDPATPPVNFRTMALSLALAVVNEHANIKELAEQLLAALPPFPSAGQPTPQSSEPKVEKSKVGVWTQERREAHAELDKAGIARKKDAQAAPSYVV